MAKVGIVMGSDSDMPVMAKAAEILDKFGIDYEMTIISAHREPDIFFEWAKSAEEKSAAESEKIREAARKEMDSLRSLAENRLEEAADRIVERIVNG